MSDSGSPPTPAPGAHSRRGTSRPAYFVTTRWTVVLTAGKGDSPGAQAALEQLCRTYWYPLYAYVRRQGKAPQDAEDLTQDFFARLLRKQYLQSVEPERGKFRTFLIVALKRFLVNEWRRARCEKRGAGQKPLVFDTVMAERRYQSEPAEEATAERLYDRRWALELLAQTMARLQQEFHALGKTREFEHLKSTLTADRGAIAYPELAGCLGCTEAAARVAVHRMRRRFREIFQEEIAQTVAAPDAIEDEVRYLLSVLST